MADCYQTILRGIGLPTKIMYIANLCSYEVDPSRRFQPIIDSPLQFPLQLRILCSCLYQVVQQCCINCYISSFFDSVTNFILSISEPININTIISSDEQQQLIENNNNNDSTIVSPTYPMSYISSTRTMSCCRLCNIEEVRSVCVVKT
ncbi:unnamed protein product [Rotaria socialis]|uniref:Uncharacterized protein n=1 Tax=Rotaria socialis TaxID=392032 RepID=A0A818YLG2_9BILA|nr:unnamed protein product [Rotaria socialis]CAF3758267.1 unnamed protein product [Rotaria socialis]